MARKYELNEREAEMAFAQVKSHIAAMHNWIASAIERDKHDEAQKLVKELREYERLFAKLNVSAHRLIDKICK